jgi:hypothetical protein
VGIGVGLFLMVFQGSGSTYFDVGTGLLSLSFGILIPGPKYSAVFPKKTGLTPPPSPERKEDSEREPSTQDEHIPRHSLTDVSVQ